MNNLKFLQVVIVLIGVAVLSFMLWEPHLEGRNAHATLYQIYFNDLFLAYVYISSIAFFIGLYQTFKLFGYIGQNNAFSLSSARSLRTIKYCAIALVALIAAPLVYLVIAQPEDDIAGGVAMGLFLTLISGIVATTAAVFERVLKKAMHN